MAAEDSGSFYGKGKSVFPDYPGELAEALAMVEEEPDLESIKSRIRSMKFSLESENEETNGFSDLQVRGIISDMEQILESREKDRAVYYIRRLARSLVEEKPGRVNDINLNRWKDYGEIYTDSFWQLDKRDRSGAHNAAYWGNFVPQIPFQLLNRYTKKGDWVLDVFLGSGTTLIECMRQGRNGVGFDLSPEAIRLAGENISREDNPHGVRAEMLNLDSTRADYSKELEKLGVESVQLAIMHPPYWDIIHFSEDSSDLSNAEDIDGFLKGIKQCAKSVHSVLDDRRYLAMVIGDKYAKGEWIPLGFRSMEMVQSAGFRLKSIVVKNFDQTKGKQSQKELWRYRALAGGFYVFKHEYIFIFEKL